jgi:cyanate permease
LLRDATPDWTISLIVVASIAGVMGALGWLAGRPGVMQPADQKPEYQPRIS